jgi:hypothetical protein
MSMRNMAVVVLLVGLTACAQRSELLTPAPVKAGPLGFIVLAEPPACALATTAAGMYVSWLLMDGGGTAFMIGPMAQVLRGGVTYSLEVSGQRGSVTVAIRRFGVDALLAPLSRENDPHVRALLNLKSGDTTLMVRDPEGVVITHLVVPAVTLPIDVALSRCISGPRPPAGTSIRPG